MLKKWMPLTAAAAIGLVTLTGCTDHTKLKDSVTQALDKQQSMKAYTFKGSAELGLSDKLLNSPNLLTGGLLAMLRESTIDWSGAATLEPLQYESDLTITPKGSTSPIAIPVLIKDSKLYFNMPALNKTADEYYMVDLQQMSASGKSPITVDSLKNSSGVGVELGRLLLTDLDAKWFNEAKEPLKLADGTAAAQSIIIDITAKNEEALNAELKNKLPGLIDTLSTNGLLPTAKADQLKQAPDGAVKLHAPGQISLAIDDQGFIRDQVIDVAFTTTPAGGQSADNHIKLHQSFGAINQTPTFTKEVPGTIKNFDDILKQLGKAQAPAN
ncbi:hypothetical protein B5M42_022235 [Paenibacillus athensensis]|uniref:Uncharacterized protein n=1 Tax=Paenibacillus athensensis TaxID=1967502 RepID=A0A4Y8PTL4_9BACL|nr:hypothetical protein [Paenibacillus athensensis]MCD1261525.1 hypothetical protein [Paenibacillus athensensis]